MEAELPLDTAGARLKRAREGAGLSLKQVSERTKIPERHLGLIEEGQYGGLPARTYATGFARSYAKAVGLDQVVIVEAVRSELALNEPEQPRRTIQTFEPGDPSRLPSSALAWIAGLLALVLVVGGLAYWRSGSSASDELPSLLPSETAAPVASQAAPTAAPTGGPVVFTATAQGVWVKFYDGAGVQLLQKELAQGESYTVPGDAAQVFLWTARPDALAITVGGQPVPKLADQQRTMKDVPVTAAALLARGVASAAPAPSASVPAAASETAVRQSSQTRPVAAARSQRTPTPAAAAPAIPATEDHSGHAMPAAAPAGASPTPAAT